jgi:hypothetical protein
MLWVEWWSEDWAWSTPVGEDKVNSEAGYLWERQVIDG